MTQSKTRRDLRKWHCGGIGTSAGSRNDIRYEHCRLRSIPACGVPGVSISQHAEHLLRTALQKPTKEQLRNLALAQAVASLAEAVERETKASWRDDPFTGQALLHGISMLIVHFTPMVPQNDPRNLDIPPAIEAEAAKMPAGFAERFRTPEGVGLFAAYAVGAEIKASTVRPDQRNEWTPPINLHIPQEKAQLIARHWKLP
jgi:hypothetical protein